MKITDPRQAEAAIELENGAVYLHAYRALNLQGLAVSLGSPDSSAIRWTASALRPSVSDSDLPGTLAMAWLNNITLGAGDRLLLGTVRSGVSLKVHGASANAQSDGRDIALLIPGAGQAQ